MCEQRDERSGDSTQRCTACTASPKTTVPPQRSSPHLFTSICSALSCQEKKAGYVYLSELHVSLVSLQNLEMSLPSTCALIQYIGMSTLFFVLTCRAQ